MKILWINPSFLDYRIPVYKALSKLVDGQLTLVFSAEEERTPKRVVDKISKVLHEKAIGLTGEKKYSFGNTKSNLANTSVQIVYQPNLLKTVMQQDADVVIIEGYFQWSPFGFIKKLLHKTPLVLSYERTFHTERNAPKWREFYRKCISKLFIDAAIVNGKLSKEYTHYLGISQEKIITGGMVADGRFFGDTCRALNKNESRKIWNIPDGQLVFLFVGRLIERKGIIELVHHWSQLDKSIASKLSLICAGEGDKNDELCLFIEKNELYNIRLLGSVEYEKLPTLYKAADVFIIPTLEDNWSLVVPEAMAAGLPIACSIYNGCWPELVKEEENGMTFDPLDETSTLRTIRYFYDNRDKLSLMEDKSVVIESKYTPESAAKSILEACSIAIEKK